MWLSMLWGGGGVRMVGGSGAGYEERIPTLQSETRRGMRGVKVLVLGRDKAAFTGSEKRCVVGEDGNDPEFTREVRGVAVDIGASGGGGGGGNDNGISLSSSFSNPSSTLDSILGSFETGVCIGRGKLPVEVLSGLTGIGDWISGLSFRNE